MAGEPGSRIVYHVSPWRRHLGWLIFGPLVLIFLGIAVFVPAKDPQDQAVAFLPVGIFAFVAALISLLTRTARLELSAEGVRLHQVGCALEASWENIAALRLMRGREGLVTREPMNGKGAERLASLRGVTMRGVPMYDAEQQSLLGELRFIPIEAFAWHLRKGRRLRDDLLRFAPHLQGDFDTPAPEPPGLKGKELWKVIGITSILMLLAVGLALSPPPFQERILGYVEPVLAPLLALRTGISAWSSFRAKSRWLGIFFSLLAVVLFLWTVGVWMGGRPPG